MNITINIYKNIKYKNIFLLDFIKNRVVSLEWSLSVWILDLVTLRIFHFRLVLPERTFYFLASSYDEQRSWIDILQWKIVCSCWIVFLFYLDFFLTRQQGKGMGTLLFLYSSYTRWQALGFLPVDMHKRLLNHSACNYQVEK